MTNNLPDNEGCKSLVEAILKATGGKRVDFEMEDGLVIFDVVVTKDDVSLADALYGGSEIAKAIGYPILFRKITGRPGEIFVQYAVADFNPRTGEKGDASFCAYSHDYGEATGV